MKADDLIYKLQELLDAKNDDVYIGSYLVTKAERIGNMIVLTSNKQEPSTDRTAIDIMKQVVIYLTIPEKCHPDSKEILINKIDEYLNIDLKK